MTNPFIARCFDFSRQIKAKFNWIQPAHAAVTLNRWTEAIASMKALHDFNQRFDHGCISDDTEDDSDLPWRLPIVDTVILFGTNITVMMLTTSKRNLLDELTCEAPPKVTKDFFLDRALAHRKSKVITSYTWHSIGSRVISRIHRLSRITGARRDLMRWRNKKKSSKDFAKEPKMS